MPVAFERTMRCLNASSFRGTIVALVAVTMVLAGWSIWAFQARVSLYEVSHDARLEVEKAPHPIEAQVAGRVIKTYLKLGERVQAGQVVVELDAATERLELAEEQAQPQVLFSQLNALRLEAQTSEQALADARHTARAALDEAQSQLREAEEAARFARLEVDRLTPLRANGVISDLEFLRFKSEAQKRAAAAESARLAVERLDHEHQTIGRDRRAGLDRLRGEIKRLESQMASDQATIEKFQHEIAKRRIEAPVSGRVGEIAEHRTGNFVVAGTKLGAIIPDGSLKVVAYFPPESALGRIQPGQVGWLRLDGFPWTQFGSLVATVTTVAEEPNEGRVVVELQITPDQKSAIPVQHGLPGSVEIEVKKVSPFRLVLQAMERILTSQRRAR